MSNRIIDRSAASAATYRPKGRRLSTKLSLIVLLMAAPIFILSLGFLFFQSRYYIHKKAAEHASSVLTSTTHRVRTYLTAVETAVNSNAWLVKEQLSSDSLESMSRRIVSLNSHVNSCTIITAADLPPQYKILREKDKAYWTAPSGDSSDELMLHSSGASVVYLKPLFLPNDHSAGMIIADISLRRLAATVKLVEHPYPSAYFLLIDRHGRYLIHPDSTRLFKKTIFSDADPNSQSDLIALGHEMTSGKQGTMSVVVNDSPCLVCYEPIPHTDWSLALVCPEKEILASYHRLVRITIPLLVIGLIFIMLLCRYVVGHAIRPVHQLLRQSQMLEAGHYELQIAKTDRKDSIGRLQNSFATMQQSLHHHINEISQAAEESRRRNEELMQATRLSEEAAKQKTLFIQNITHQIRTPLNIIMGFSQVLHDSIISSSTGDASHSLLSKEELSNISDMMTHSGYMLNRMVLMLFDSSDTGIAEELKTHKNEQVPCNDVAHESIGFVRSQFRNITVAFTTEVPDDFCITTNRQYPMLSLRELLYNSAKYSDGQHISLHISLGKDSVRFIVEDKGPGISEEEVARMFTPFVKANDLSEGLGLGLPLSKQHAIHLGGNLLYDTNYHDGCRFIFELPRTPSS